MGMQSRSGAKRTLRSATRAHVQSDWKPCGTCISESDSALEIACVLRLHIHLG